MDERERKKHMRARRRRRRRKKMIRALLLTLMFIMGIFIIGLVLYIGKSLFGSEDGESGKFLWNMGSFGKADIVLDAGHGGKDQGASSGNVLEKAITLVITEKTAEILENAGYEVGLVRDDDTFVELEDRIKYGNRKEAKVFVSIHCNSAEEEADGIETFYAESKEESSQKLAKILQEHLITETGARDREVKTADYAVILGTEMPAALVEVGFLSDAGERTLLQTEAYQEKLAEGIAQGIIEYLNQQQVKQEPDESL